MPKTPWRLGLAMSFTIHHDTALIFGNKVCRDGTAFVTASVFLKEVWKGQMMPSPAAIWGVECEIAP